MDKSETWKEIHLETATRVKIEVLSLLVLSKKYGTTISDIVIF